jgi:pyridoxal phosphate enzyme (YggS family)
MKGEFAVQGRLAAIQRRVESACGAAGRRAESVFLIAVSKGQSTSKIEAAYAAGHRDFGESYAQEFAAKQVALQGICPEIRWHFIGRIQSNKAGVIARAHRVHSVGSLSHARALARKAPLPGKALPILLQVNLDDEEQKGGFSKQHLGPAISELAEEGHLAIKGIMAIPPLSRSEEDPGAFFSSIRRLRDECSRDTGVRLSELSMGMSRDFEAAILEGATWIRVGTAIFGERASNGGKNAG